MWYSRLRIQHCHCCDASSVPCPGNFHMLPGETNKKKKKEEKKKKEVAGRLVTELVEQRKLRLRRARRGN